MSNAHYDTTRKEQANALDSAFVELYEQHYGSQASEIRSLQNGLEYASDDNEKTLADLHDMSGADRILLLETGMGAKPVFVEEKTRTFKPDNMQKFGHYNGPTDEDLALTVEYHNKKNQPKHRKQLDHVDEIGFVPSLLAFVVYNKTTKKPFVSMLIDYQALLSMKDEIDYQRNSNDRDGNTTDYIPQDELVQRGLVEGRYFNYDRSLFNE